MGVDVAAILFDIEIPHREISFSVRFCVLHSHNLKFLYCLLEENIRGKNGNAATFCSKLLIFLIFSDCPEGVLLLA